MHTVQLPYGVVVVKNFLSSSQQFDALSAILQIWKSMNPAIHDNKFGPSALFGIGIGKRMGAYCLSPDTTIPTVGQATDHLIELGSQIAAQCNDVKAIDPYKKTIYRFNIEDTDFVQADNMTSADAMYCIRYPQSGTCYRHIDLWNSWVMSISFGASCDFTYGLSVDGAVGDQIIRMDEQNVDALDVKKSFKKFKNQDIVIRVSSGDLIMFNGNLLHHSITKIYDDLPECWDDIRALAQTIGILNFDSTHRINIQYRDSRTMDNNEMDENIQLLNANNMNNMRQAMQKI